MPKFLNERQIGMDPAKVGFPNLGDCMAMVLLDEGGLFGFHLTRGDLSNAPRFVQYVQSHRNYTGNLTGLYAAANFKRRYGQSGSQADWENEMTGLAGAAAYHGTVHGYDLGNTGIKAPEAIYVEFRVVGSACSIWYKRMSKMATDPGNMTAPDDDIRELAPDYTVRRALFDAGRDAEWDPNNPVRTASTNLGPEWDPNNPVRTASTNLGRGDTRDARLAKTTRGNKGELHAVKAPIEFIV